MKRKAYAPLEPPAWWSKIRLRNLRIRDTLAVVQIQRAVRGFLTRRIPLEQHALRCMPGSRAKRLLAIVEVEPKYFWYGTARTWGFHQLMAYHRGTYTQGFYL